MSREKKEFEVWHPKNPADEPLTRERPYYFLFGISDGKKTELTATGYYWLVFPWMFFISKRLKFSLSEALFGVASISCVLGKSVSICDQLSLNLSAVILLLYALFHTFTLLFTWVLYEFRLESKWIGKWEWSRPVVMLAAMAINAGFCH